MVLLSTGLRYSSEAIEAHKGKGTAVLSDDCARVPWSDPRCPRLRVWGRRGQRARHRGGRPGRAAGGRQPGRGARGGGPQAPPPSGGVHGDVRGAAGDARPGGGAPLLPRQAAAAHGLRRHLVLQRHQVPRPGAPPPSTYPVGAVPVMRPLGPSSFALVAAVAHEESVSGLRSEREARRRSGTPLSLRGFGGDRRNPKGSLEREAVLRLRRPPLRTGQESRLSFRLSFRRLTGRATGCGAGARRACGSRCWRRASCSGTAPAPAWGTTPPPPSRRRTWRPSRGARATRWRSPTARRTGWWAANGWTPCSRAASRTPCASARWAKRETTTAARSEREIAIVPLPSVSATTLRARGKTGSNASTRRFYKLGQGRSPPWSDKQRNECGLDHDM
eukprot:1191208-Prorocentrum_minimum.AAC.6